MKSFCNSFLWNKNSFFVYASFRTEADTHELIARLHAAGKTVCLPRMTKDGMIAALDCGTRVPNAYGIEEPPCGEDVDCEVVLAPLLAVDKRGVRLGYGGGYYDGYFNKHPNALRVGLCYAGQAVEALPREQHDILLQAIVTEEGVRFFEET